MDAVRERPQAPSGPRPRAGDVLEGEKLDGAGDVGRSNAAGVMVLTVERMSPVVEARNLGVDAGQSPGDPGGHLLGLARNLLHRLGRVRP